MRARLTALVALAAFATGANADEACGSRGSSAVLTVKEWRIEPIDATTNKMTEVLVLQADKPVRMIDGSIAYVDALGEKIGLKEIDRDARISPDGEYVQSGNWGPYTFERLLKMDRSDIIAIACVEAVIYADGTRENFAEEPGSIADELSDVIGQ